VENISSEFYFYIIAFFLENKPFSKFTLKQYEKQINKNKISLNIQSENQSNYIGKKSFLIATPNIFSKLSPSLILSKSPLFNKTSGINIEKFDLKMCLDDPNAIPSELNHPINTPITHYHRENENNNSNKMNIEQNIELSKIFISGQNNNNNEEIYNLNENDSNINNKNFVINVKNPIFNLAKNIVNPYNNINNPYSNRNPEKTENININSNINSAKKAKVNSIFASNSNQDKNIFHNKSNSNYLPLQDDKISSPRDSQNENQNSRKIKINKLYNPKIPFQQLSNKKSTSQKKDIKFNSSKKNEKINKILNSNKDISEKNNINNINFQSRKSNNSEEETDPHILEKDIVKIKGHLYKLTDVNKMKKLYFSLYHKDLYCKN